MLLHALPLQQANKQSLNYSYQSTEDDDSFLDKLIKDPVSFIVHNDYLSTQIGNCCEQYWLVKPLFSFYKTH